jgi:hypothetical protein
MADLFDDMRRVNTGRLRADQYSFLQHTLDYPPPGEGWFLVTAVATSHGSSSSTGRDGIDRGGITSMSMTSSVVGIWARRRTDEDKERENRSFDYERLWFGSGDGDAKYPEWVRKKREP